MIAIAALLGALIALLGQAAAQHHRRVVARQTSLGARLWAQTTDGRWWYFDGHDFVAISSLPMVVEARVHVPDADLTSQEVEAWTLSA